MAEVLPLNFPIPSEGAIASYDFLDIATGLGFVRYLGLVGQEGLTKTYTLSPESLHSRITYTDRSGAGTTTISFDTSVFNLPRTAKGTAIFSCARFFTTTEPKRLTVTVQKVDAQSNVTSISSGISSDHDDGALNVTVGAKMIMLKIPLTQTQIKKGEKIRIKCDLVVDSGTGTFEIGHDPKNQNGSSLNLTTYPGVTTVMTFLMPFKIEA